MLTSKSWNDLTDEPLTLENVKKRYIHTGNYRIQSNHWNPTDSINGFWAHSSGITTYYIQKGTMLFRNRDTLEDITVSTGDIIRLPRGDYIFKVVGDTRVELIQVSELPEGWS
ncbi:cupin domain-containing protein [Acinetobacter sp. WZC-1]|uniref:cupin domain-containing protein n=1 Tax=Acinetobacter sp. WZC-1 TaxID=3459034 RepID=UPI00403DFE0F